MKKKKFFETIKITNLRGRLGKKTFQSWKGRGKFKNKSGRWGSRYQNNWGAGFILKTLPQHQKQTKGKGKEKKEKKERKIKIETPNIGKRKHAPLVFKIALPKDWGKR